MQIPTIMVEYKHKEICHSKFEKVFKYDKEDVAIDNSVLVIEIMKEIEE